MYMLRIFHNQNFENTAPNSPPSFLYLIFIEKYTFNVKHPTTISCYQLFPTWIYVRMQTHWNRLNWPRDSILYIINTKTNTNTFNEM